MAPVNRRDALALLTAAGGAGLAAVFGPGSRGLLAVPQRSAPTPAAFPKRFGSRRQLCR